MNEAKSSERKMKKKMSFLFRSIAITFSQFKSIQKQSARNTVALSSSNESDKRQHEDGEKTQLKLSNGCSRFVFFFFPFRNHRAAATSMPPSLLSVGRGRCDEKAFRYDLSDYMNFL